MLFAAGIGISIMFYGVLAYEHALTPPLNAELRGEALYRLAMATTVYHWAFHLGCLCSGRFSTGVFCYNGLPLLIRSTCYQSWQ